MVTINYNGQTIEVEEGKKATLRCYDHLMKSDVVVSSDIFSRLTCNGRITDIDEGMVATVKCGGKVMRYAITLDTSKCKVVMYDSDNVTLGDEQILPIGVKVTFVYSDGRIKMRYPYTADDESDYFEVDYGSGTGITDDPEYVFPRYDETTVFTLDKAKVYRFYLRRSIRTYWSDPVWIIAPDYFPPDYVDGKDFATYYYQSDSGNIFVTTWEEWVNSPCNTMGTQIINGYIYTFDGKCMLHDSNGVAVKSTDQLVINGKYTFVAVT